MMKMKMVVMVGAMLAATGAHSESDAQFKTRYGCQVDGASAGKAVTMMRERGTKVSTLTDAFDAEAKKTPAKAALYERQADIVRYVDHAIREDAARNEKQEASFYAAEVAALCVSFGGVDSGYLKEKVTR